MPKFIEIRRLAGLIKKNLFVLILLGYGLSAQTAELDPEMQIDLIETVISSSRETNELRTLPASVSIITPRMLDQQQITSVVNLSAIVPNFFIPNYGSKLSTPVFVRGIGNRSGGQAVGLYVDNMPLLSNSVFNFDFLDVQQIEVLRGPQGTLYGRNAMSGVINIRTHSPLDENRTRLMLSAGNYGLARAHASVSRRLIDERLGISLSGHLNRNNGFFENQFDGERADRLLSAGGRMRLDFQPSNRWNIQWITSYDYSNQGAFPYGIYENGDIALPNQDHPGEYIRQMFGSHINLQHTNNRFIFTSTTGFQHLNDNMDMDLDNTPLSLFTLNQRQNENNFTQEFTLRSNTENNLQWIVGAFGFHRNLRTYVTTTMGEDGIATILQPQLPMVLKVSNNEIPIPGTFETPAFGGAFFAEATRNNLFFRGLSATIGARLDYESTSITYNTSMLINIDVVPPPMWIAVDSGYSSTRLTGRNSMSFTEFLPRFALKYEFNNRHHVYFSVARGYKAGGHNIQMFADIIQGIAEEKGRIMGQPPHNFDDTILPREHQDSIIPQIRFNPEHSWNFEIGFRSEILQNRLFAEAAVFYIDVRNVLITQFVETGHGRMLRNAGHAESMGAELSLRAFLFDGLVVSANYGFTRAIFRDNKRDDATDFSGNFIPFAPRNTFSIAASYTHGLRNNRIIDRFNLHAQYNGVGRIYWTEANDVYQNFYGLLNLRAGVSRGIFSMNIWTRNTLNTNFTAFYFESMGQRLGQRGTPFQIGVDLAVRF
ncbi:MAG: TonB-dependent receptor [Bacteroidales bacterium]|nr:TonB-dependent receptor [Bacteroidales bacterium]